MAATQTYTTITFNPPFGMVMPNRSWEAGSAEGYRFGFNGMEGDSEIVGEDNSLDFGARIYDARLGRWSKMDNFFFKYPDQSPFAYALNNPTYLIDCNGKEVFIYGEKAQETTAQLDKATSLELKYNNETGQVTALGEPVTEFDKELLRAINDKAVKVQLITTPADVYDSKNGSKNNAMLIGGYEGSEIKKQMVDGVEQQIVETTQLFNYDFAVKLQDGGLGSFGVDAGHEIMESFYGGEIDPGGDYDSGFRTAHNKAMALDTRATTLQTHENTKTQMIGLVNDAGKFVDLIPKNGPWVKYDAYIDFKIDTTNDNDSSNKTD